jgi:hypothetical protein
MKCKFFKTCDFVVKDAYTCNHDEEACEYCGAYRLNEKV